MGYIIHAHTDGLVKANHVTTKTMEECIAGMDAAMAARPGKIDYYVIWSTQSPGVVTIPDEILYDSRKG